MVLSGKTWLNRRRILVDKHTWAVDNCVDSGRYCASTATHPSAAIYVVVLRREGHATHYVQLLSSCFFLNQSGSKSNVYFFKCYNFIKTIFRLYIIMDVIHAAFGTQVSYYYYSNYISGNVIVWKLIFVLSIEILMYSLT